MQPDSMLVEPDFIATTFKAISESGADVALAELRKCEPALAGFVSQRLTNIAGKLALTGAPTPIITGVHADMLAAILTAVKALQHGHYNLWRDTMTGSRLAHLDEQFRRPTKRSRRKKGPDAEPSK